MSPFPTAGHLLSVVGWAYAAARRERRQAALDAAEERRAVAQTCARAVRICRGAGQEHLPAGPVPAPQTAPRAKKAAIAVAASILTAVYHLLRDGTFYNDLGPQHFARHDKTCAAMRLVRGIKDLGYDVEIKAAA